MQGHEQFLLSSERVFTCLKLGVHTGTQVGRASLLTLFAFVLPRFLNSTFLWSFLLFFPGLMTAGWHVACSGCFHGMWIPACSWWGSAMSSEGTEARPEGLLAGCRRDPSTAAILYASSTTPTLFTAQRGNFLKAFQSKSIHGIISLSSVALHQRGNLPLRGLIGCLN